MTVEVAVEHPVEPRVTITLPLSTAKMFATALGRMSVSSHKAIGGTEAEYRSTYDVYDPLVDALNSVK